MIYKSYLISHADSLSGGVIDSGCCLAFCNLQHCSSPSSKLVELFATDKTVFMQYPTEEYLSAPLEKMSSIFQV